MKLVFLPATDPRDSSYGRPQQACRRCVGPTRRSVSRCHLTRWSGTLSRSGPTRLKGFAQSAPASLRRSYSSGSASRDVAPSIWRSTTPGCQVGRRLRRPPAERRHIQIRADPVIGCLNWCGGTKSASGQPPRHPGSGTRYGNGFPPRCTVTRCNQALLATHSTAFSISRRKSSSQKSFWCPSEV